MTLPEHGDLVVVEEPDMLVIAASRSPGKALDLDAPLVLVTAVGTLLSASLIAQARPIVRELRSALEGAQVPRATVIDLGVERSKRGERAADRLSPADYVSEIQTARVIGPAEIVQRYARRFTIEETFRDIKDNHFGMGLSAMNIRSADRRDRLLFISAIAQALLTQLGAAGEACGLDRILKTNTVKTRTMSLFNQGSYWYRAIPNMREERLRPLMEAFGKIVSDHAAFKGICGVI